MAGKDTVFVHGALGSVMQGLSKNQLIDLVADIVYGEMGEDLDDAVFVDWLQQKMNTVWHHRGDAPKNLRNIYLKREQQIEEFREKMRKAGKL